MSLPRPPRSQPHRMLFLVSAGQAALVQRCVDPQQEELTDVDFGALGFAGSTLVAVCSARWLVYTDSVLPLISSTHRHRHVRGRVSVEGRWVTLAQISAGYTPEFAAVLAS